MRNPKRVLMKTTLLLAILTLGLLPGLAPEAEAQSCGQRSQVYISGYHRCGTPIYRVRYISGYDRCGRAIWGSRGLTSSEYRYYHRNNRSYSRPQYRSNHHSGYSGYGHSRITYSTSSGRGTTYRYYSSSSRRCW